MPLRNFGLSFSRRDARANALAAWRPPHAIGLAFLIMILIVLVTLFG
jgi:hypothetical protein